MADHIPTSDSEIKVPLEVLREKADTAEQRIAGIRNEFSEMEQYVKGMGIYWKGEAAEGFQISYQEKQNDICEILDRLKEQIDDLRKIAGIYQEAEQNAVNTVEELTSDILV